MQKLDTQQIDGWPEEIMLGAAIIKESGKTDILSESEKEEYQAFTNQQRKAEFLSARILFHELASEWTKPGEPLQLKKEPKGKPFAISGDRHLNVSFSHSTDKVYCAISFSKVIGLDVEHSQRQIKENVVRRILNEEEWNSLRDEDPVLLWTIKEATVKCLGTGLRTNLKDLTIKKNKKNRFSVRFNNEKSFEICSFRETDHQIALAYQSEHI